MSLTHIYKKETEVKLLDTLNYTIKEFMANPQGCYPEWNKQSMIASEIKYEYPVFDNKTQELREMTKYEKYKKGLYELQYNEAIYKDDVLVLEAGQYIKDNEVITVPKIEGTRVEWDWINHIWEDKATNLDIVQTQYKEYEGMDTPSVIREMELQDLALAEEFVNMLIELRKLIYTLSASETQVAGYAALPIPQPSEKLKEFKNKFKLTK